jgi:hypothetical protein
MIEILEEKIFKFYANDKPRKCVKVKCSKCGKFFWRPKREVKRIKRNKIYCSRECTRVRFKVECKYCGKEFERSLSRKENSKSGFYFCSRKCKDLAQHVEYGLNDMWPNHYKDGSWGKYRKRALKEYENQCSNCENKDVRILDVHHIDSNRKNNKVENLILLCRNCHGLVTLGYAKIDEERNFIDLGP